MKSEKKFKEFYFEEFQNEITKIIDQLTDKDCTKVEFLRGMLSVYKELTENRNGWTIKPFINYFDHPKTNK